MKVQRDHLVRGQLPPVVQGQIPATSTSASTGSFAAAIRATSALPVTSQTRASALCGALAGLLRERLGRVPIHQEQFRAQRGAYVRARHLAIRPRRR